MYSVQCTVKGCYTLQLIKSISENQFENLPSSASVFCSSRGGVGRRAAGADVERSTMNDKTSND